GDVDTQDLAEMGVEALAVALRVATGPAVAGRDVEHPVRPEHDRAAVVVGEWLGDVQQDDLGVGIAEVRIGATDRELRDDGVPVAIGVVHEEARIRWGVGVEGESEQTALAHAGDPSAYIEERTLGQRAALDEADPAGLFGDEQPPAAITGVGDVDWRVEPVDGDRDVDGDPG